VILAAQLIVAAAALCFSPTHRDRQREDVQRFVVVTVPLEGAEAKFTIMMGRSQKLLVILPWQPTGSSWQVTQVDKTLLNYEQLDDKQYQKLVEQGAVKKEDEGPPMAGREEKRVFEFSPLSGGTTKVELHYSQSYDKKAKPNKIVLLRLVISDNKPKDGRSSE
jgi:predicted secreted protein